MQELATQRIRMDKDARAHFAREKESRAEIEKLKADLITSKVSVPSDVQFGPQVGPLPQSTTVNLKPAVPSMDKLHQAPCPQAPWSEIELYWCPFCDKVRNRATHCCMLE